MPIPEIKPGRKIHGASAVLLPFRGNDPDWSGFEAVLAATLLAGLVPAVNMDTGSTQFIDDATRARVLEITGQQCDEFIAGCFVADQEGSAVNVSAYQTEVDRVVAAGALPIVFPSWGLNSLPEADLVPTLARIAENCDAFLGFELGPQFVPYGRIYELSTFRELLGLNKCVGAKHSSLSRQLEWQRLALRDECRQDFRVYTGNDLAIDMVMWGSDYLLGLSTFDPAGFAARDRCWELEDPAFFEINDRLQYLGAFAFRAPVPGYKHNAAQLLKLKGVIQDDSCPPGTPPRPDTDIDILKTWLDT